MCLLLRLFCSIAMKTRRSFHSQGELVELQRLGASGNLTKDHLSGGTFTISNIGIIVAVAAAAAAVVAVVGVIVYTTRPKSCPSSTWGM